jgi:predicted transcriptional regulator of viral defense system
MELLRRLALEGDRVFSTGRARELAPEVDLKGEYVNEVLSHLSASGWIVRLRRGLYALSSSLPGVSPLHEFEVAMALVSPAAISHWSAMHFHGLTEQAPRTTFVLTTTAAALPRRRDFGNASFRFVQVRPPRFFGVTRAWVGEARVALTDPERTLLDGLTAPRLCGDFAEVLHGFAARGCDLDLERIVDYALRLDAATAMRLGWVLEHIGTEPAFLSPLEALPAKGYRLLDPSRPPGGPHNRRWRIQENLPGKVDS